jgi:hypothetical protein
LTARVLIGVDKDNKIISGTSLYTARLSLAEDLVFLASLPDISIYVVDGPITLGDTFIPQKVKTSNKQLIERIDKIFEVKPECWQQRGCNTTDCECDYSQWQQLKQELGL